MRRTRFSKCAYLLMYLRVLMKVFTSYSLMYLRVLTKVFALKD